MNNNFFVPEDENTPVINTEWSTMVVHIPRAEYIRLLHSDTCLEILRHKRLDDIQKQGYVSLETEDYILGGDVVTTVINRKKADKGE